jgi:hypothetical protein
VAYRWIAATQRYQDTATGRFVSERAVRAALDDAIQASANVVRDATQQLRLGQMSVADWQTLMMSEIKAGHLASGAAASGGFGNLTQSQFGYIGSQVKAQYQYLRSFAADVVSGKQRLDGTLLRRSELYAKASRGMFHEMQRRTARLAGWDEERRILNPADHCDDCVEYAARSWQPIGTLPRIGESACRQNCQCAFEVRRAA